MPDIKNYAPKTGNVLTVQNEIINPYNKDGSITQIDLRIRALHQGTMYRSWTTKTILSDQIGYIQLKTGALYTHLDTLIAEPDQPNVIVEFFRDTELTDGTIEPVYVEDNDNSNNITSNKIYTNPTITNPLNMGIPKEYFPLKGVGTNPSNILPTSGSSNRILLLKPNTNYVLKITNNDSNTLNIFLKLFWWEEETL